MNSAETKIISRDQALELVNEWKRQGLTVGFTSGTFDLLHAGHVSYLEGARAKVDKLVLGLNSDYSVKLYKGPSRPIVDEVSRARVVAGLSSVDAVFLFDETNNNVNIELLKPDVYLKAGDYSKDKLSSAKIIEGYGGRVELVSFVDGKSTTSIIERLQSNGEISETVPPLLPAPILFLDRDGTIIEHVEYIHEPQKVVMIPGALATMKRFQDQGFRLALVTNQPGIGLGYFTKEEFFAVNREIFKHCREVGVVLSKIYFSPFTVADKSPWSKPSPGMIERGLRELNGIRDQSIMVGDNEVDMDAGRAAKLKRLIFVGTGALKSEDNVERYSSLGVVST